MSSIEAQQQSMDVIGNNLANVNTTGFKSSSVDFANMFSQVISEGVATVQLGQGVMVAATPTDLIQGTLTATGQPSDLALQGNGFFMVDNGGSIAYTRDGGLTLNASGELVQEATGDPVLGYSADASGTITPGAVGVASTITVPIGNMNAAQATSSVSLGGNLNASALATATITVGATVFDGLGGSHAISLDFSGHSSTIPAGAPAGTTSVWQWSASQGTTSLGTSKGTGNQPLYFNSSGVLLNPSALGKITIPASGSSAATSMSLNFGSITQNAGTSDVSMTTQNGAPPGQLQSFSVSSDGTINGVFSNGISKTFGADRGCGLHQPGRSDQHRRELDGRDGWLGTGIGRDGGRGGSWVHSVRLSGAVQRGHRQPVHEPHRNSKGLRGQYQGGYGR